MELSSEWHDFWRNEGIDAQEHGYVADSQSRTLDLEGMLGKGPGEL